MTDVQDQHSDNIKHWILCSSGAQPLFLENIARALALPSGETIRFRYEQEIVAPRFRTLASGGAGRSGFRFGGHIAYLSYLDNRDESKTPQLYPVREAKIISVEVLGTSYIIDMKLHRFIDWSIDPQLDKTIASLAEDPLPNWASEEERSQTGINFKHFWVAGTKPLDERIFQPFSSTSNTHLKAFEETVKTLVKTSDFKDGKRLFATVLGLKDTKSGRMASQMTLEAGCAYELHVYHFQPGSGTHTTIDDFRLETTIDNPDVSVVGATERRIEAPYDEVMFPLRVADDARDRPVNLGLNVTRLDTGATAPTYILRSAIRCNVQSAFYRKLLFGALIGLGLFGTQAVTLFTSGKQSIATVGFALAFSVLAGMGASFQFRTKI